MAGVLRLAGLTVRIHIQMIGLESSQMEICSDGKEYVDLSNDHEESSLNAGEF